MRGDVGGWRNFLHRCARTCNARSGGVALQRAAGAAGSYAALLACELGEEDSDQIAADVGRSAVDDIGVVLGDLVFEAALREALGRVLRAWCARRAGGYCQGMNFAASVVLAVMRAGRPAGGGSGAASPTAPSPTAPSPTAAAAEWEEWEEAAFWTFVGMVGYSHPADFYAAPEMAGLQRECRVLQILARSELRALRGLNDDEVNAVLHLLSYKWFIPFYVNCVPIRTHTPLLGSLGLLTPRRRAAAVTGVLVAVGVVVVLVLAADRSAHLLGIRARASDRYGSRWRLLLI